jgi:hypothetical protein
VVLVVWASTCTSTTSTIRAASETICNETTDWERQARPLHTVIYYYKLEMIFGCTSLQGVYIGGIYVWPSWGGKATDLDVLEDLSK